MAVAGLRRRRERRNSAPDNDFGLAANPTSAGLRLATFTSDGISDSTFTMTNAFGTGHHTILRVQRTWAGR